MLKGCGCVVAVQPAGGEAGHRLAKAVGGVFKCRARSWAFRGPGLPEMWAVRSQAFIVRMLCMGQHSELSPASPPRSLRSRWCYQNLPTSNWQAQIGARVD